MTDRTLDDISTLAHNLLLTIGRVRDEETKESRLLLFQQALRSSIPLIRMAAINGIALMNEPLLLSHVREAMEQETETRLFREFELLVDMLEGKNNGSR